MFILPLFVSPISCYTFTDTETDTSFVVPENWSKGAEIPETEFLITYAVFSPHTDPAISIGYSAVDLWASASPSAKRGLQRSDLDTSDIPDSIFEQYGVSIADTKKVTYGDQEFFKAVYTGEYTDAATGIEISRNVIDLVCGNNGYLFRFQFFGREDSAYFKDFESVLNSAIFPADSIETLISAHPWMGTLDERTLEQMSGPSEAAISAAEIILSVLAAAAVYALPIVIYRFAIRRKPVASKKAASIAVTYGICAFVAIDTMVFYMGGSTVAAGITMFIWTFVNHATLNHGYEEPREAPDEKPVDTP